MGIKVEKKDDRPCLYVDGDLTIYTVLEYKKALLKKRFFNKDIDVDLSEVEEIDSSGIQLLASINKQIVDNGCEMKITKVNELVSEALEYCQVMGYSAVNEEG